MSREDRASAVFRRLRAWYGERANVDALRPPASAGSLDALAEQLGRALPEEMRALYGIHDGAHARILPQGAWLRSVSEIATTLSELRDIIDEHFEDCPATLDEDRAHWDAPFHRAWVPFATREDFDVWIDLDPGPNGRRGQILYPIGEASVRIVAPDLLSFLERWCALLESGSFAWSDDYGCPMFPSDVIARSTRSLQARPAEPTTETLIDMLRG